MRKFFTLILLVILAIFSVLAVVFYKKQTETNKPVFAFVINVPGRFWEIARAGCQQAAREEDVIVNFYVPGQSSAAQQKQIVESLVAKGCNGLAISPLNPESMSRLIDEVSRYMPVICQDSDAPDSKRIAYVGTDNYGTGYQAGELMAKVLPEGGEIAIFCVSQDISNQKERKEGIVNALAGNKYKIVGVFSDQGDRSRSQANARTVVAKYPDLKGIVCCAGHNGFCAAIALRDYPENNIKIIAYDDDIETLEAIRNDAIVCSLAQNSYEFGYQSIKLLARLHRGEQVNISENKKILVPVRLVTKDNVDEFKKEAEDKLSTLNKKIKFYQ